MHTLAIPFRIVPPLRQAAAEESATAKLSQAILSATAGTWLFIWEADGLSAHKAPVPELRLQMLLTGRLLQSGELLINIYTRTFPGAIELFNSMVPGFRKALRELSPVFFTNFITSSAKNLAKNKNMVIMIHDTVIRHKLNSGSLNSFQHPGTHLTRPDIKFMNRMRIRKCR